MRSFRSLLPYLKAHRWALVFGVIFVFGANGLALWVPILIGQIVNKVETRSLDSDSLFLFCLTVVALAGIAGCFRFLMRRVLIDASREIEYEFRNDLFRKLQRLDPPFFDSNNTGDLMSRATNDMDALRMLIGPGIMYSANTILGLPMVLAGMLALNWKLTLLSILPMAALPPLVKYFGSRTHRLSRLQQDSFGALTTMVQENLAGIRVVKAYNQTEHEREKFRIRNDDYISKSLQVAWLQSIFYPSIRMVVGFGFAILLIVGGFLIINGAMLVGTLISFLLLFAMLVWPLIAAGWVVNLIQRGVASLDRINVIFDAEPKVRDADGSAPAEGPLDIHIKNLTFQYEDTPRPQLLNIDLHVRPGQTLGIVGPVGSGKSTLVHLLARLYPVPRDTIIIGGRDINDWPLQELRSRIGFVFQETFLFSDTIGWNIRFGASDDTPQELVETAAKRAQVHEDIAAFPKGYETVLGERGVNLSGGQKQRVAIARALVKDAEVLVLDDALSAVDTHTEEAILRELKVIMQGKTTFLISHRISTVALSDEIIVIEEGRITQRGHHEYLIQQPGLYAQLHSKQLSEAEVEEYEERLESEEPKR